MTIKSFAEPVEKKTFNNADRKKTLFLDLNSTATFRILTDSYVVVSTHYINRATVLCLGDDCPVCRNNKALIMQFPETFRDEPKYSPRRELYLVNVLDKTPVRTCPNCDTESRITSASASTCVKCNQVLTDTPKPSNKIKVLSRGVTLFENLGNIRNAIRSEQGEVLGLDKYDITLVVSGSGKNKVITPIAGQVSQAPEFNPEDLYDLETVTMKLDAGEMVDLQRGVSLKDIFAARRSSQSAESFMADVNPVPSDVLKSVQDDVDKLFKV